jgi:hypothetical protein
MTLEQSDISWLSNTGYNFALRGVQRLVPKNENLTKSCLLAEQYYTELILQKNGLKTNAEVKNIPGINKVFNLSPLVCETNKGNFHIEIKGMPRSGKDKLIEKLNTLGNERIICTKEPYSSVKEWKKQLPQDSLTQQHLQFAGMLGEFIAGEVMARKSNIKNKAFIIHNRGLTDNPILNRAKFLYGEIPINDYFNSQEGWIFKSSIKMDAVIIFMQHPQISIFRSLLETRSRRHITSDFLSLLYEQYLRDIVELRSKNQSNLLIIDTSNDIETNFQLLKRKLSEIIGVNI